MTVLLLFKEIGREIWNLPGRFLRKDLIFYGKNGIFIKCICKSVGIACILSGRGKDGRYDKF